MERYANLGGNSGIDAYEADADSITIRFKDGAEYRYTISSAGENAINTMKMLAEAGHGLNTYITLHVKDKYEMKLRESVKAARPFGLPRRTHKRRR